MNTEKEIKIKEEIQGVQLRRSYQDVLAETLQSRNDMKDKDRRLENTERLVAERAADVHHQRIIFIHLEPCFGEHNAGKITKHILPFILMALLMVAQWYLPFPEGT